MKIVIVIALIIICLASLRYIFIAYTNSSESMFVKAAFLGLAAADVLAFSWMYNWVTGIPG